jgi:hypothetical protein
LKYIYIIQSLDEGYFKIGISKNPEKRILQLQTGNSSKLKLIDKFKSQYPNKVEKTLHNIYSSHKKEGEWFGFSLDVAYSLVDECKKIEKNIEILKKNENIFI